MSSCTSIYVLTDLRVASQIGFLMALGRAYVHYVASLRTWLHPQIRIYVVHKLACAARATEVGDTGFTNLSAKPRVQLAKFFLQPTVAGKLNGEINLVVG